MKKVLSIIVVIITICFISTLAIAKPGGKPDANEETYTLTDQVKIFVNNNSPYASVGPIEVQKEINAWLKKNRNQITVKQILTSTTGTSDSNYIITITVFYETRMK